MRGLAVPFGGRQGQRQIGSVFPARSRVGPGGCADNRYLELFERRPGSGPAGIAFRCSYFAGLYQLSRPVCSFLAAASGVSVPLITLADSTQVSFSRFGVPRDRIW